MEEHKRKPLKYVSFCSGVEAASQAWKPLGWEPVAFSEIEPFPSAVLAARFPDVPNLGDMTKIHYDREKQELSNGTDVVVCPDGIDLVVGGTPCQSFSVAGKREGLEGASGLAEHYARLLGEIRPRTAHSGRFAARASPSADTVRVGKRPRRAFVGHLRNPAGLQLSCRRV